MTSLVLGAAGAFIGSYFGPVGTSLGWAIGSGLGQLIDQKDTQGPKLNSLRLQGASYGQMIPYGLGTFRLAGVVIYNPDLVEHELEEEASKGGATNTTFSYTASFAVKILKKPPNANQAILGVRRCWADQRLVYDVTGFGATENEVTFTEYHGTATALPDPTMEADLGVGNVPAFRDDAAIVADSWQVEAYGNRIPSLEWEVFTNAGEIPVRLNTFDPPRRGSPSSINLSGAMIDNGYIRVSVYTPGNGTSDFFINTYDQDGNFIEQTLHVDAVPNVHGAVVFTLVGSANNSGFGFGVEQAAGTTDVAGWYYNGALVSSGMGYYDVRREPFFANGALYSVGGVSGSSYVSKWIVTENIPSSSPITSYSFTGSFANSLSVTVDELGFVWVGGATAGGADSHLYKFDEDLNLIHEWLPADTPADFTGTYQFTVWHNLIAWMGREAFPPAGRTGVVVYEINGDYTFTHRGWAEAENGPLISLGNGLCLGADGLFTLSPPPGPVTLADVITLVSELDGLSASQIDVTDCPDLVHGCVFNQQADGRSWLEPILNCYSVASVESGDVVKFRHIGSDPVVSIPDEDLGAYDYGGDPVPLLPFVRTQEVDLPKVVYVSYFNKDAAYQINTQHAQRQVTSSEAEITVNVPLVLTDAQALSMAWTILMRAWLERDRYTFYTSRKYTYLEPIDVVTVQGKNLRIVTKNDGAGGVIKFEAVPSLAAILSQSAVPAAASGYVSTPVRVREETLLLLLDIPLVRDEDAVGFYAAMAPVGPGSWAGASLMKSVDGSGSYSTVASSSSAAVMGTTSDALPTFAGGNVFDESNFVTVVANGALSGATEEAVLNGANMALFGNELLQFKNADLVDVDTYTLSGLLRGRRGTEWAMVSHHAGERFVLMNSAVVNVGLALSEFGLARSYKAVTSGATLASASAQVFTSTGISLQPYSPVHIGGGPNTSGDVEIHWTRRTRIGGAWRDLADVPLSEVTEAYVAQIWNADFTLCARIISAISPACTYTSAQQVTDFGAQQEHIYVTVGQVGSYLFGRQESAIIPGAGSGDDAPLAPVTPYGTAPPAGGAICVNPHTTSDAGSTHNVVYNTTFAPGTDWVVKFTTPTIRAGAGRVVIAEWGGDVAMRHGTLSTEPCGAPAGNGCVIDATTLGFWFYLQDNPYPGSYPTLLPSTAYYITVSTDVASGAFAEYTPP